MAEVVIEVVDGGAPAAMAAVQRYVDELAERFPAGFDPGLPSTDEATATFGPPSGRFLLATLDGEVVGCGGVQFLDATTAEIKRMWVSDAARGQGLGRRLLAQLEDAAVAAGRRRIVLDTNGVLDEALGLYRSSGYVAIDRYNDNPYATHFFAKDL